MDSYDLVKVHEAAIFLGVCKGTVRRWGDMGLLAQYRVGPGRHRRYRVKDLEEFLKRGYTAHF